MEFWFASSNKGKIRELEGFLLREFSLEKGGISLEFHSQSEISVYSSPPETGDSFEANARIKARGLRALKSSCWVIADDSGLEVEGLNNLPGVHSARYAGDKATDIENRAKLLKMVGLRCATHRQAQFRCVMVVYSPKGVESVVEGVLKGSISRQERGAKGFGYDPLFIPEGWEKTMAEMELHEKNQISHRGQALNQVVKILQSEGEGD